MKGLALLAVGGAVLGLVYVARQKAPAAGSVSSPQDLPAAIGGFVNKIIDTAPRGIRNNNPLNIEYNARNNWDGQTGTDGRFAQFATPFYGIRAAARLLKNYASLYRADTVRGIVTRWAPPTENNTEAYIESVKKRSGLNDLMILTPTDYPALIAAMIYHENGEQPYSMALITEATQAGFA